jgi:hypothetical protein
VSGVLSQIGFSKEATWGTAVTPVTRFFEYVSESITPNYARIESNSLRAGQRVQRSDRWATNFKGAAGTVEIEVMSKGFGFFLEHLTGGTVVTTGPTETTAYNHQAKLGSLTGKGITTQVGRPMVGSTVQPFTYAGGKVTGWELANSVDGFLVCRIDLDHTTEVTATGLGTASYPTTMEVLNYLMGLITVGGAGLDVSDINIREANNPRTDRYFIRQSGAKKEQIEGPMREITVTGTIEYDSMVTYNRVSSATAAGAMADIIAKWEGSLIAGATTLKNSLIATLNTARFDVFAPVVSGPDLLTGGFTAKVVDDGDALTALALDYKTSDVTP